MQNSCFLGYLQNTIVTQTSIFTTLTFEIVSFCFVNVTAAHFADLLHLNLFHIYVNLYVI
jgi:hypothetical protein